MSGSFSLGGLAAPYLDPTAFMAVRFLFASAGLLVLIALARRLSADQTSQKISTLSLLTTKSWRFVVLGVLYGSYFIGMFEALRLSEPAPVSAVFTLTPIMTALVVLVLFRQATELVVWVALIVGAAGAVWVIFDGRWSDIVQFRMGEGEFIFLGGVFAHAVYSALTKRLQGTDPLLPFVLGIVLIAFVFLIVVGFEAIATTDWFALPLFVWLTILYLAYMATMFTISLLQYASQRLPAPKVMAYTYLVPAIVIVMEGLSGRGWASLEVLPGVGAIMVALLILALRPDPQ